MTTIPLPCFDGVESSALTDRLWELRKAERALLVEFLAYLGELDRRRVVQGLGFPSLFCYCRDHLGLPNASAYRRTTACRLLRQFPIVGDYLMDGRLCLTTLVELRDVLEEPRLVEILDRAAGHTEEQVKELVAALRPRPAPPDLLRRLPAPSAPPAPPASATSGSGPELTARPELTFAPATSGSGPELTAASIERPHRPAKVEPIADATYVLRATVGAQFKADLDAVR